MPGWWLKVFRLQFDDTGGLSMHCICCAYDPGDRQLAGSLRSLRYAQVACALPRSDDCCDYTLTCDKGLYVPKGTLSYYYAANITTSIVNVTLPAADSSSEDTAPQVVVGSVNATMTCQACPQGNSQYDFACDFGVPEGIRPGAGGASN